MQKKISKEQLKKILIFTAIELVIAIALVAVDIVTKAVAFKQFYPDGELSILGGFIKFTAVKNTGASFGMFGSSTVALSIVSLISTLIILGFMAYSYQYRTPLLRAALVFVLAGAAGNMVDRFTLQYVRDIVQLSIFPWVFNAADTYLTVGVILLLVYVVFFYTKDKTKMDKEKAGTVTAAGLIAGAEADKEVNAGEGNASDVSSRETAEKASVAEASDSPKQKSKPKKENVGTERTEIDKNSAAEKEAHPTDKTTSDND